MYIIGYLTLIHAFLQNLIYSQQVLTKLCRQLYINQTPYIIFLSTSYGPTQKITLMISKRWRFLKIEISKIKVLLGHVQFRSRTVHPQLTPLTLDGTVLKESADLVILRIDLIGALSCRFWSTDQLCGAHLPTYT